MAAAFPWPGWARGSLVFTFKHVLAAVLYANAAQHMSVTLMNVIPNSSTSLPQLLLHLPQQLH